MTDIDLYEQSADKYEGLQEKRPDYVLARKVLLGLVAMKDIKKGQELVWDYDMTEDSDWRMECLCETPSCRKVIGSFSLVPDTVRQAYKGYISDWLVEKYKLEK